MHEGGGLAGEIRVEIVAAEGRRRPGNRGLQAAPISQASAPAESFDLMCVKLKDLLHGQVENHSASLR